MVASWTSFELIFQRYELFSSLENLFFNTKPTTMHQMTLFKFSDRIFYNIITSPFNVMTFIIIWIQCIFQYLFLPFLLFIEKYIQLDLRSRLCHNSYTKIKHHTLSISMIFLNFCQYCFQIKISPNLIGEICD